MAFTVSHSRLEPEIQELPNSTVRRWTSPAGVPLFEKRYRQDGETKTLRVLRSRMAREAIVSERLMQVRLDNPRLGIPQTLEFDFDGARIVMVQAPGTSLLEWLQRPRRLPTSILRAMFLSGAWLKLFQSLPVTEDDLGMPPEESRAPLEYCRPRIDRIVAAGLWFHRRISPADLLDLIGTWSGTHPPEQHASVWAHCDYAPFNVLWDGRVLTGIDLAMSKLEDPLLDATYFVHRLEMLGLQRPWQRLPIEAWSKAFLRGFSDADVVRTPHFTALMIRHCLNRMGSMIKNPGKGLLSRAHARWMMYAVRHRLRSIIDGALERHDS